MLQDLFQLIKLGRFPFLFGGLLIFSLGALLSFPEKIGLFRLFIIYFPVFLAQLSVSYSNDYFDYSTDSKTKRCLISGGSGVLQKFPHLKSISKKISLSLMGASIFFAFLFSLFFQLPLIFFIFVCTACILGWFYSAPPLKLSHRGMGEIITLIVVGTLLLLTANLATANYFSLNNIIILPSMFFYSIFPLNHKNFK